ncbi:amidohydrolase family protein [Massilia sp. B-10]|nr:amidohydrolase family protein [Massilia sp. B-10]
MAAGRRAGLNIAPERAIVWLTANPARAVGVFDKVGSLDPGKQADVVLWSGDPFSVYAKADLVYIDGVLMHDRASARPASDFVIGTNNRKEQP